MMSVSMSEAHLNYWEDYRIRTLQSLERKLAFAGEQCSEI